MILLRNGNKTPTTVIGAKDILRLFLSQGVFSVLLGHHSIGGKKMILKPDVSKFSLGLHKILA